jgi:hypothetical protein
MDIQPESFLYQVFMDHARRNSKKKQMLSGDENEWKCE